MTKAQDDARKAEYDGNVAAHIAAHAEKGETKAVKAHMKVPEHKAIVEAAAAAVDEVLAAETASNADTAAGVKVEGVDSPAPPLGPRQPDDKWDE